MGDLEILSESTLAEIPRGDKGEVLRVTFTKAKTPQGKQVAWHGLRVWFKGDDGEMRPGKAGITLRSKELEPVLRALVADFKRQRSGGHGGAPAQPTPRLAPRPAPPPPPPAPPPVEVDGFGDDDEIPF